MCLLSSIFNSFLAGMGGSRAKSEDASVSLDGAHRQDVLQVRESSSENVDY